MKNKILKYIFICFSLVFLMSHNTYADVLSVNVRPKWTNFNSTWQFYVYQGASGTNWIGSSNSASPDAAYKNMRKVRFSLPNGIILGLGDYITADLILRQNVSNNSLDLSVGPMSSDTSGIRLISAEVAESSNIQTVVHFTFYVEQTISVTNSSTYVTVGSSRGSDANIIWWFDTVNNNADLQAIGGGSNYYTTVSNTDYSGKLNDISSGITNLNSKLNSSNTKLDNINNSINQLKNKEETSTTNIENQSSSDIGNSEDQKTQSLLGVFASFVGAVTAISPSNCNVDFDLGHIDFGEQNLCSSPVPTAFQVISSIIVLAFTVPFVVHIVRRILGLIREMQT